MKESTKYRWLIVATVAVTLMLINVVNKLHIDFCISSFLFIIIGAAGIVVGLFFDKREKAARSKKK